MIEKILDLAFTGTRNGMETKQAFTVRLLLARKKPRSVHHGDCKGADAEFHAMALKQGCKIIIHPPTVSTLRAFLSGEKKPPKPYLERNQDIVDSSSELIAAPETEREVTRSGTWSTVRYARKKGKLISIVLPSGELQIVERRKDVV